MDTMCYLTIGQLDIAHRHVTKKVAAGLRNVPKDKMVS